jgi:hypothetical protein
VNHRVPTINKFLLQLYIPITSLLSNSFSSSTKYPNLGTDYADLGRAIDYSYVLYSTKIIRIESSL